MLGKFYFNTNTEESEKLKFREVHAESHDQGISQKKRGDNLLKQIQKFWQDKEITLLDRTQDNKDKTDAYYSSQTEVVQSMTVEGVMHKSGTVVKSALVNAVKELTIKAILESEDFSPLNTEINLDDFIFYKYYPESNQTLEFTSHETNFKIQPITSNYDDPFFYLKSSNINNLIDYFIRIIGTNEAN
ncbi:hypothetical protein [Lactobacillus helveticus]|uniref:hypothetical protein n=1 Tax=Lactobacillus helveticus TaxID=1587 RepID=UPI0015E8C0A8|nr:hypothetical protein [Lactobacillus helveticus]